jgi:hypothetical protein
MMHSQDPVDGLDALVLEYEGRIREHEQEIQALHTKIAALAQDIADTKTRRNALTSRIAQLPSETIARIFHFLQSAQGHMERVSTPWIDFNWEWTRCMLVCRRFRDVAIDSPRLWSFICHEGKPPTEWIILCVTRAKTCPLTLGGSGYDRHRVYKNTVVAERIKNVQRLYRRIPPRHEYRNLDLTWLEQDMPLVQVVHCAPSEYQRYGPRDVHHFSPHFLGGSSSTLKALTLHDVAFSKINEAPSLPALTYLDIHFSAFERIQHFTQLVAVLRNTPALEILAITCRNPQSEEFYDRVPLPQLQTLKISGHLNALISLVGFLPHPSCRLSITKGHGGEEDGIAQVIREFITEFWANATGSASLELPDGCWREKGSLSFGSPFSLEPTEPTEPTEDEPGPRLYFETTARHPNGPGMPLESVTTLVYDENKTGADQSLSALASSLQHVMVERSILGTQLQEHLIDWLRNRVRMRRPLKSAKFIDCGEGQSDEDAESMAGFAKRLRSEGLADAVSWTPGDL